MTGEAVRGAKAERRGMLSQTRVRRGALALLVSGGAVAALVTAGIAGSSRGSDAKGVKSIESRTFGDGVPASDLAVEQARSATAPVDARDAAAEFPSPPSWLGLASDPMVVGTASAQPDRGPGVSALRKAAPPPARPALRAAPAKARLPDDGRDELYVPEAR
jgi:hypothetical protein